MDAVKRTVEIDFGADTTRWGLADVDVWQCRKCKLQLRVTIDPPTVETYPLLMCARCLQARNKRVFMDLVNGPDESDPQGE